jgi:hypothetical protein
MMDKNSYDIVESYAKAKASILEGNSKALFWYEYIIRMNSLLLFDF